MVNSISAAINNYTAQIPQDSGDVILKSAVFSFVLGTLVSSNAQTGLAVGALAATVSAMHALTTPLFKKMIGSNTANVYQRIAHTVVNLGLVQLCVNSFTHVKVNLMANLVISILLSLVINGTGDRSLNHNATYLYL